ncbi:sugar transferase [Ruixingdingia sedimenti]|uniref:Sugar transferase n=1 Tax=Ruixingdingia sedimenti TaxID=3073604 RepID=A0ABU1F7I8_9RHOB|nr:sugar transferase [Xinfangfangia sp. LG-4]MDR5652840.1 sugar transferase [Xinfangfangia sp. LG-4]
MTINYTKFPRSEAVARSLSDISSTQDFATIGLSPYRRLGKRLFDIFLVLLSAPFVVPLVLVLALLIAREGGRPFYTQIRVGRGGRMFRMWKLRSMVVDADARMAAHLAADPEARREWDETQKLRNDPRITRFGRFLRMSSLDELPQLWNVLIGDMSLVGPRPMMPDQQEIYPGRAYYALRPGITGYWQTAGRNRTSFAARAHYDAEYVRNLSLPTDAAILMRTVRVVIDCTGY